MNINIEAILKRYDLENLSIATLASHSAINILRGAKARGLRTIAISKPDIAWFYRRLWFIDEVLEAEPEDFERLSQRLVDMNAILIPHGSLVEYVGWKRILRIELPILGNRYLLEWESNQEKKMKLLERSGIPTPKVYKRIEDIDRPVIVKLPGAKGGRGYFVARSKDEILKRLKEPDEGYIIQEYLIGVPAYYHYFSSRVMNRIEIFGMDIRYESNVDGRTLGLAEPSFVVVGNIPLVLRESLLPKIQEYGERFVKTVEELVPPGLPGPFCLESIIGDDLTIKVFEFSARIVAGTNVYMGIGSPYSLMYFEKPIDMGERIAIEIIEASRIGKLLDILT
ncbi:MAG: formate--phosphoribosylaminoimidazolecarboxamide ligase [Sulfolobales archaeon]